MLIFRIVVPESQKNRKREDSLKSPRLQLNISDDLTDFHIIVLLRIIVRNCTGLMVQLGTFSVGGVDTVDANTSRERHIVYRAQPLGVVGLVVGLLVEAVVALTLSYSLLVRCLPFSVILCCQ